MTVTVDLPKIYLFDVEINENIFQIKEKEGKKASWNKFDQNHNNITEKHVYKKCDTLVLDTKI